MEENKENTSSSNIIIKTMEEVMHNSMMPYSEHVIMDRALPRVEDGLKPVQRRILYAMHELGITPDKPYRKSARIVGDCLGKYHPHGDKSIYDAMVRLSQPWSMRHILADGHGNFGSIDGDGAAAMRYTEVRMAPLALELLRDLDKDTVKWSLNFDDTTKEPDILPGRFPNLLVNGAYGIAVGLATNIPPHNLAETIDGVIAYIDNPRINLQAMMKIIKGPDFPTGGTIITGEELEKAYETGKGKIVIYPKINIEIGDYDKRNIVITELPYQVNKAALLQSIVELREEKKGVLSGISEICDESDRDGMRAVIRVKKDFDPREICTALFKSTQLSQTFGINIVAIADGKPQQMGLLDIISYYVEYQRTIIVKRTRFELNEAKEREHILEGLMIAVKNIDEVIAIIKASSSPSDAKQKLRERFALSDRQAQAVLDIRLARLTHMEIYKLEKDLADVKALIIRLETILGSKREQMDVVKYELGQIKRNFKEPRRSAVIADKKHYVIPSDDDVKPVENYMLGLSPLGELKRMPLRNYSLAQREFSAKTGVTEICETLIPTRSNQVLYCFSNLGFCYKLDPDAIPESKWRERGVTIKSLVSDAQENEKIIKIYAVEQLPVGNLLFYTKSGLVKKSEWSEYNLIKSAFQAIKLKDDDIVIGIEDEQRDATLLFVTEKGMCLNAIMSDIPIQGRVAGGVKGVMLADDDSCVFVGQVTQEGEVALITDKAFAKRVVISQIDPMARYRKGVKIADLKNDSGDNIVFARYVKEPVNIILHDTDEYLSCFSSEDFTIDLRTAKGKALCKMSKSNKLINVYIYSI